MSVPGMSPFDAAAAAILDRARVAQFAFEAFAWRVLPRTSSRAATMRAVSHVIRQASRPPP